MQIFEIVIFFSVLLLIVLVKDNANLAYSVDLDSHSVNMLDDNKTYLFSSF